MATNSNHWQSPPNASPPSGSGPGLSPNSHHLDDAPLSVTVPLEDSRVGSNPTSPSDHSEFQLAQQQVLMSQALQQRPTRKGSAASFATGTDAGAPPSRFPVFQ